MLPILILCQGMLFGKPCIYPVEVQYLDPGKDRSGLEAYVVDLGWSSYLTDFKMGDIGKYQIVGNLSVFAGQKGYSAPAVGSLERPVTITMTIAYPSLPRKDDPKKPWVLQAWLRADNKGPKSWVSLEEASKDRGKYGIDVRNIRVNRDNNAVTFDVYAWPADDAIIAWDG